MVIRIRLICHFFYAAFKVSNYDLGFFSFEGEDLSPEEEDLFLVGLERGWGL